MSPAWIAAFLALAALNLALVGVVLGVVRRALAVLEGGQDAPLMARDGPPPGAPLPAFEGSTLDGRRVESSELLGEPAVLLFLSEGCEACDTLVLAMRSVRLRLTAARLVLVTSEDAEANRYPSAPRLTLIRQQGQSIQRALGISALPSALTIDASGTVRDFRIASGTEQLQRLIERAEATLDSRRQASPVIQSASI